MARVQFWNAGPQEGRSHVEDWLEDGSDAWEDLPAVVPASRGHRPAGSDARRLLGLAGRGEGDRGPRPIGHPVVALGGTEPPRYVRHEAGGPARVPGAVRPDRDQRARPEDLR